MYVFLGKGDVEAFAEFLGAAKGVGIGLEIDEEVVGAEAAADAFLCLFNLLDEVELGLGTEAGGSPFVAEGADALRAIAYGTGLGDVDADFVDLGTKSFSPVLANAVVGEVVVHEIESSLRGPA